jgi:hypothetical protein
VAQGRVNEKMLNVRMPESEFVALARQAAMTGRTKTEIVREFIRSLPTYETRPRAQSKSKAAKS